MRKILGIIINKVSFDLFIKSLIYRFLSLILCTYVLFRVFGFGYESIKASLIISSISTGLYFAYDLIWDKIYYAQLYNRVKDDWFEFKDTKLAKLLRGQNEKNV